MTVYKPLPSVGRLELFGHPEGRDIKVYDGSEFLGWIFPEVVADPDTDWYAKRPGQPARRRPTDLAALSYLAGRPIEPEETE